MLQSLLLTLLAVAAGFSIVVQQALNANLKTVLNSGAWSGFASYFVGFVCMMLLVIVLRDPVPAAGVAGRAPFWAWSGGVFGAFFIFMAILLIPQLGAATFMALIIAGQMVGSVVFDHFGLLGLAQRSVDAPRLIGVALLIAGVLLIRR